MGFGGARSVIALVCAAALVAAAAPAALSSARAGSSSLVSLDAGVLRGLNAIRAGHGLVPLRESRALEAAAAQHSREMAADGYFAHDSFDGSSFSSRIAHWYGSTGYSLWTVGENLLWSSPSVDPTEALRMWMSSPGHRRNILDARWREIGVSAVHAPAAAGTFRDLPVTIITTDFGFRR